MLYNMQMATALGASNAEEAMQIIQAAGIERQDVHELMMDQAMLQAQRQAAMTL